MCLGRFSLRDASRGDLDDMAQIHMAAFPGFFLTRMGLRFLRLYYATVINFDSNISLLACDSKTGQPLGFAVGFLDPQGFYHSFRRQAPRLILPAFFAFLHDPGLAMQILRNVGRVERRASKQTQIGVAELSSIAVAAQGMGIGGALLEAFVSRGRDLGASEISLTTDADDNRYVRDFYERHGFNFVEFEVQGPRRLCRYNRSIG